MSLFWTILRSIIVPLGAYFGLRETNLGEEGAVFAVATALTVVTIVSMVISAFKLLGNTLLFRGNAIIKITVTSLIQITALIFVWWYYIVTFTEFTL